MLWSSGKMSSSHEFLQWAAGDNDPNPWVELELSERSNVTGKNIQNKNFRCKLSCSKKIIYIYISELF